MKKSWKLLRSRPNSLDRSSHRMTLVEHPPPRRVFCFYFRVSRQVGEGARAPGDWNTPYNSWPSARPARIDPKIFLPKRPAFS